MSEIQTKSQFEQRDIAKTFPFRKLVGKITRRTINRTQIKMVNHREEFRKGLALNSVSDEERREVERK